MEIAGRTFVVSGGASGLGAGTARMLVASGGRAVLADLNERDGEALALELGERALFVRTDVAEEGSAGNAIARALERFGAIHGLVNCAGIVHGERVLGREVPHALASFAKVLAVNVTGTFNMTRLAAAAMARNDPGAEGERGVVVFTASVAAFDGQVGQAAYSASKGAVAAMTLPVARELARVGIRVVAIAPGLFETPMMHSLTPEMQASLGRMVPFPPRLGRPDEFASLVGEILRNVMLNGEVIRLDGAIRMQPK